MFQYYDRFDGVWFISAGDTIESLMMICLELLSINIRSAIATHSGMESNPDVCNIDDACTTTGMMTQNRAKLPLKCVITSGYCVQ